MFASVRQNGFIAAGIVSSPASAVIPGRIEDANQDVQLHILESRDSGSGANAPARNDEGSKWPAFS